MSVLVRETALRRSLTIPAVGLSAAALGGSVGVWAPVAMAADLLWSGRRFPRLRLLSFALAWSSLESVGVCASTALWAVGRSNDREVHYAFQRWWAARLIDALHLTANVEFEVDGLDALAPGPLVICARHVSVADSLLPTFLLSGVGMRGRYVFKDDLLIDPCLDIVGGRLPNHFVDRDPQDSPAQLKLLETLVCGMGPLDAAVIFPEGTIASDARRERAIASIAARDPRRAERVRGLKHLAPVRPGGTAALLQGSPDADLVFVTHTGFEPLNRLADAPAHIPFREPVRVEITRASRSDVPDGDGFIEWFDDQWARCDQRITAQASRKETS